MTNEPETLCVAWLSTCQQFSLIKDFKKALEIMFKDEKINLEPEYYDLRPAVGAVAVKYAHANSFSVFIGIAMGEDEKKDIAYIKSMGQRQPEHIARAIFPQFDDMAYHN